MHARPAAGGPFTARAVLIDLDGTLLDTALDLAEAVNRMLTDLGRPTLDAEQVAAAVGKGAEVLVHRVLTGLPDGRADPALFQPALSAFLRHYHDTNGLHARIYPGVREGLQAMRDAGLALACVTNKPQAYAEPLLARLGLAQWFAFVQGGDALPHKKPDPRPLLHAAARLGAAPALTVAIGDSLNDAQAARAAGMTVLVVPYGYNEGAGVQGLDVDAIVDSLWHAAALIRPAPAA
ncbi:MAG: phosphoglycolate phosphatase [Burkholderiales bacterium]|jgi:phosphoglycolate phosphatase